MLYIYTHTLWQPTLLAHQTLATGLFPISPVAIHILTPPPHSNCIFRAELHVRLGMQLAYDQLVHILTAANLLYIALILSISSCESLE